MSRLRILEENRRKPKSLTNSDKKRIIGLLTQVLGQEDKIILAVIHGGFVNSKVFRDIDIAIYTNHRVDEEYIDELRDRIEKKIGMGIDIQLLNYAPPFFTYNVLKRGLTIVEKISGIKAILRIHSLEEIRKLRKL